MTRNKKPTIGKFAELTERNAESGEFVSRRDLLNAAAALGVGAGVLGHADTSEAARRDKRGKISYVLCNRALNGPVKKLAFSAEHAWLGALSEEGRFRLWDARQLARPLEFRVGTGVDDFAWGRGGLLVVETKKGAVTCLDAGSGEELYDLSDLKPVAWAFTPTGTALLTLDKKWRLARRDARSGVVEAEIDLAKRVRELLPGKVEAETVLSLGSPSHAPGSVFLVTPGQLLEATFEPESLELVPRPVASADEVLLAESGELVAYRSRERGTLDLFTLPDGRPWLLDLALPDAAGRIAFSPTFERCLVFGDQVVELSLDGVGSSPARSVSPEVVSVTASTCAWEPRTYAWGSEDGRIIVLPAEPPPAPADAPEWTEPSPVIAVTDPEVNRIEEFKPEEVEMPFADCSCTCNSVEVTDSHNERITQVWDTEHQRWTTITQPCGTPLPAGAVCICNCVSAPSSPIWTTICTCDLVCTCNPQSNYRTLTYWY